MKEIIDAALVQIPRYFTDLLDVSMGPKRFVVRQCANETEPVNEAFTFLGITLLADLLLQLPLVPAKENLLLKLATFAVTGGLMLLATLAALRIAWMVVGGTANMKRLFVCTAYLLAPMLFIMVAFFLVGDVMFRIINPEGYQLLRINPFAELPDSAIEKGGFFVCMVFLVLGLAAGYAWFFVAWGAYRILNGVSRFRSAIAFFIYNLISIPLMVVGVFLGFNLSVPPS